jgi:hypothetical protein
VSGRVYIEELANPGTITEHDWGRLHTGEIWLNEYRMDDPRLTGTARALQNAYGFEDPSYGPRVHTTRLENAEGSWVGTGYAYQDPTTSGMHVYQILSGEGAYEGLTAILQLSQPVFGQTLETTGVVFSGPMPATPENPPPPLEQPADPE